MNFSLENKTYNMKPLPPNSPEYKRLSMMMQGNYLIEIMDMYSIHNPYLYEMYCIKYNDRKSFNNNIQVMELFHCTHVDNVHSIVENNFDWRRVRRVKYGRGVSFSRYPDYANLHSSLQNQVYWKNKKGVIKAMFIVDVIVGFKQIGNKKIVIPNWPCDTTVNEDETVFVKFFDHEFYPKYVIYYISYPVISDHGQAFYVM